MSDGVQRVVAPAGRPAAEAATRHAMLEAAMKRLRATDVQFGVFVRGADAVLQQWTALHLAAQHSATDSRAAMRDDLLAWVRDDGELYPDELEEFFDDFFREMRGILVEDGSQKEVATILHDMYRRCCHNDDSTVRQYEASLPVYLAANVTSQCQLVAGDNEDEDEDGTGGTAVAADLVTAAPNPFDLPASAFATPAAAVAAGADSAPVPQQQQKRPQQRPQQRSNAKNPSKKGADGWSTVSRR